MRLDDEPKPWSQIWGNIPATEKCELLLVAFCLLGPAFLVIRWAFE